MLGIYEPKGKAKEYGELAVNLYRGCGHGCTFCYAPSTIQVSREAFGNAVPRLGIIQQIEVDAKKLPAGSEVFLCFTCDPYQMLDCEVGFTRKAIEVLHFYHHKVNILTKGGLRAVRDFDLLSPGEKFGTTLTFNNDADSKKWEPNAALPQDRIDTIKLAHDKGIATWVSLEPVIDPAQTLDLIRQTYTFVDQFKVGKLNHHPLEKTIDWQKFGREAVALLESLGKNYYIKVDLKKYLN